MTASDLFEPDSDRVSWRDLDGDRVLIDLQTAEIKVLRGSASVLWGALLSGADEATLAFRLVERYGIDAELAAADAAGFLRELRDLRYVRIRSAEGDDRCS